MGLKECCPDILRNQLADPGDMPILEPWASLNGVAHFREQRRWIDLPVVRDRNQYRPVEASRPPKTVRWRKWSSGDFAASFLSHWVGVVDSNSPP